MTGFICTTCDRVFENIPASALQITGGRGLSRAITYKFDDGSFHTLRTLRPKKIKPRPEMEQQQTIEPPVPLPAVLPPAPPESVVIQPSVVQQMVETALEIRPNTDDDQTTTMAAAFRRMK